MDVEGVKSRTGLDSFLFFCNGKDTGHKVASILDTVQLSQERLHHLLGASQDGFSASQRQASFWVSGCSAKQVCV